MLQFYIAAIKWIHLNMAQKNTMTKPNLVCNMLLFDWSMAFGINKSWVCHKIASVLHNKAPAKEENHRFSMLRCILQFCLCVSCNSAHVPEHVLEKLRVEFDSDKKKLLASSKLQLWLFKASVSSQVWLKSFCTEACKVKYLQLQGSV